jgi:hypothetical protein
MRLTGAFMTLCALVACGGGRQASLATPVLSYNETHAPLGTLSIGGPKYKEFNGNRAYVIYPVTFANTQSGKPVVYKEHLDHNPAAGKKRLGGNGIRVCL